MINITLLTLFIITGKQNVISMLAVRQQIRTEANLTVAIDWHPH